MLISNSDPFNLLSAEFEEGFDWRDAPGTLAVAVAKVAQPPVVRNHAITCAGYRVSARAAVSGYDRHRRYQDSRIIGSDHVILHALFSHFRVP